jgi:hypothetical protein
MTWAEGVKGLTIPFHNLRPRLYFRESVARTLLEIEAFAPLHDRWRESSQDDMTKGNLKRHVANMASQGTHWCAVFQE